MKHIRKLTRFTALLLILAVSLTLFPVSGTDTAAPAAEPVSTEVLSLREENVKHFAVGNNTYQAVAYGHPVHKLDENGNWVDVDNSLTLSGSSYATEDGRVTFTKNFAPNQNVMTLAEGDTSVAMALLTLQSGKVTAERTSTARVVNPNNLLRTAEDAMNAVFSSSVTYEEVLPDTDLEYTVDAGSVKEYIVVNEPQTSYAYHFALTLMGLTAQLEEDGSVGLYTAEGEKKYTIPAPYMFDAAGNFSHAVAYTLLGESGKYFLTVTADAEWLNASARAWPVMIAVTDVCTTETAPKNDIVLDDANAIHVSVPSFTLPYGSTLDAAWLSVYCSILSASSNTEVICGAFALENPVTTYDKQLTQKANCSTLLYAKTLSANTSEVLTSTSKIEFDIIAAVNSWVAGNEKHGVVLKKIKGAESIAFAAEFITSMYAGSRVLYNYTYDDTSSSYSFVNRYDTTFEEYVSLIHPAIQDLSSVYSREFFTPFTWTAAPVDDTSRFATCPGSYVWPCDDNCRVPDGDDDESNDIIRHHKNIVVLSDHYYQFHQMGIRASNELTVFWTDHNSAVYNTGEGERSNYCDHNNIYQECAPVSAGTLGLVYMNRPVIQIVNLLPDTLNDEQVQACMALVLMHETAHALGLQEIYKEFLSHDNGDWTCVMMRHRSNVNEMVAFYENIVEGNHAAFCSICKPLINNLI